MKLSLRRSSIAESVGLVCSSDLGGTSVRIFGPLRLASRSDLPLWRLSALAGGWIDPVPIAEVPFYTAFAVEVLGSAPPSAVGAVKDSRAILYFQPFRLHVYVASALDARE